MKLVEHFDTFLKDSVDLNATRLQLLDESVSALKDVLGNSEWEPTIREYVPQGSWAHKTIIRPVEGNPFDADLLVLVDHVDGWDAKKYLTTLRSVFAEHGTYKDKVKRWSHCVTIQYAGERNIDIAPCVVDRDGAPKQEVCNSNANVFELSEPKNYTLWLIERNGWTGGNGLRKVTRLHKYLRDIKTTFSCPSILLTTLLGARITALDSINEQDFADVPTALHTITQRLDDWLQAWPTRPVILNPVLATEVLSDLWDDDQYANFREKFHTYRTWIDDAYDEPDRDESIGKWRRVFGDEFAAVVAIEKASRITESARQAFVSARKIALGAADDLVNLVSRFGQSALPPAFDRLPHKQRPRWHRASTGRFDVVVKASWHSGYNGPKINDTSSGQGPLPKGDWLRFRAHSSTGLEHSKEYEVTWRVANTDLEASRAKCLRGDFYSAHGSNLRWEELRYRGVHTVEAFVVRKRDRALVAQSDPYYVVVA